MYDSNWITGDHYKSFIQFAIKKSDHFMLLKFEDELSENAESLLEKLQPYFIRSKFQKRWPGTITYGKAEEVLYFKAEEGAGEILMEYATGIYDWRAPQLLDDLCFFKDDKCWFPSTTHEYELYFEHITDEDRAELRRMGIRLTKIRTF